MDNLVEWIVLVVLLSGAGAVVSGYAWRLHRLKHAQRELDERQAS